MRQPVVVLVGRQRPHHVMLLLFSLLVGMAYLWGLPQPRTVTENLGDPFQVVWSAGLALSGAIGLTGAYWRGDVASGLSLERSAMIIGAGAVFGYAWTVSHGGQTAIFATGFCLAWGVANLFLAIEISRDLRGLASRRLSGAGLRQPGGIGNCGGYRRGADRSDPGVGPQEKEQRGDDGNPE